MVLLKPFPLDCLPLVKVRTGGMLPGHQELKRSEQTSSFILAWNGLESSGYLLRQVRYLRYHRTEKREVGKETDWVAEIRQQAYVSKFSGHHTFPMLLHEPTPVLGGWFLRSSTQI